MSEENIETQQNEKSVRMWSVDNYDELQNMLGTVNAVGRMDIFNLPQQIGTYYNVEDNNTATNLTNMILDAERDESWRMRRFSTHPNIITDKNEQTISFADVNSDKVLKLYDVKGYIPIPSLQTIIIIPGDKTLQHGDFRPDEVIRLTHLLLRTTLFCQMSDVQGENGDYKIGFTFKIIDSEKS